MGGFQKGFNELALRGDSKSALGLHIAVGHTRSVKCSRGKAIAVEQDQTARGVRSMREFADASIGNGLRQRERPPFFSMRQQNARVVKKIDGHFGHHNFHDAFTVSGAGHAAGFGVSVTATANERRVADASGEFAARAAGGSSRGETSVAIDCDSAHRSVLVADMMLGCVRIFQASAPGRTFTLVYKFLGSTERYAIFRRELFRTRARKHHVFTFIQHAAGKANWIAHALHGSDGAGFQGRAVHHDSVKLDVAITIQMRAETRVECGIVFENYNGGLNRIHRRAGGRQNSPTLVQSAADSCAAVFERFVRNIPCATVND